MTSPQTESATFKALLTVVQAADLRSPQLLVGLACRRLKWLRAVLISAYQLDLQLLPHDQQALLDSRRGKTDLFGSHLQVVLCLPRWLGGVHISRRSP
jgi:hypothetical protein